MSKSLEMKVSKHCLRECEYENVDRGEKRTRELQMARTEGYTEANNLVQNGARIWSTLEKEGRGETEL